MKITNYEDSMIIQKRSEIIFVSFLDILYIERFGNSTIIHTMDNEIVVRISLHKLFEFLPSFFLRSHKSFIVNTKKIKKMKNVGKESNAYEVFFSKDKSALLTKENITLFIQ
ncbi:LytTR family transcriptional regulator DNA-binding domain-containing protein (plasmid) [Priestia megaterium]|uniref:LytR/AlgR family response regulator transcription factor n=1 Tax=Priestia megaterium TaxID=1404 RepID=UPI001EDACE4F|nr:LytTR family DNA-binding domain-containing protein [Priestia megaterium]UKJ83496.1 LytTR family transcriptional regulator DNA-binding domain-containing protein [Priestia megaterium]